MKYMKKIITCGMALIIWLSLAAQSARYDSVAILIVDRMADMISGMESCSFKLATESDVMEHPYGMVKEFGHFEVFMSGPNKMVVNARGHKGHRQFLYNGQQLCYYSYDENNFGSIPAPSTTIRMIDSINKEYGIEFPAADFFYPAFTDDMLQDADSLRFLGKEWIEGKEYFHVLAYGKKANVQFWINDDSYNLPGRFVVTYKEEGNPQYQGSFEDWEINPRLPDAMFAFLPPPGAHRLTILSKSDK
jgi:hypothetical protein